MQLTYSGHAGDTTIMRGCEVVAQVHDDALKVLFCHAPRLYRAAKRALESGESYQLENAMSALEEDMLDYGLIDLVERDTWPHE